MKRRRKSTGDTITITGVDRIVLMSVGDVMDAGRKYKRFATRPDKISKSKVQKPHSSELQQDIWELLGIIDDLESPKFSNTLASRAAYYLRYVSYEKQKLVRRFDRDNDRASEIIKAHLEDPITGRQGRLRNEQWHQYESA